VALGCSAQLYSQRSRSEYKLHARGAIMSLRAPQTRKIEYSPPLVGKSITGLSAFVWRKHAKSGWMNNMDVTL
jgi:hypothetical protein